MGKKSSPPAPPDPAVVAQQQTGTNVNTAIANTIMGQVGRVGPDGTLRYDQTGSYTWTDPSSRQSYTIPTFTAVETLSRDGEAIRDAQSAAQLNLAEMGRDQSGFVQDYLSRPFNIDGLPPSADRSNQSAVQYQNYGGGTQYDATRTAAPQLGNLNLQTSYGAGAPDWSSRTGQQAVAFDPSRMTEADFSADRQRVEDALMARMQPQFDAARDNLERNLANRGVRMGSDAYGKAYDTVNRAETDARFGAILNAGQEQSRLQGLRFQDLARNDQNTMATWQSGQQLLDSQDAQRQAYMAEQAGLAGFGNQAQAQQVDYNNQNAMTQAQWNEAQRQYANQMAGQQTAEQRQAIDMENANATSAWMQNQQLLNSQDDARSREMQVQFALRNQPLNEINSLISGSQVATPNFQVATPATIPTFDYAGAMQDNFSNQMAVYQQQAQDANATMGAVAGLAGSAVMLSDETLKTDIRKEGRSMGQDIHSYRYKGEPPETRRFGVIAQKVAKTRPDAVKTVGGKKAVDYGRLFKMEAA